MTTPDTSILALIKTEYPTTVYFAKFPQAVRLNETTPKILILNITHLADKTKDGLAVEQFIYRIEVIGTRYLDVFETADVIKSLMITHTDDNVYLVDYQGGVYDTDETAEIHRIIKDYKVFANEVIGS